MKDATAAKLSRAAPDDESALINRDSNKKRLLRL
jgi:hypothetical protein